MFIQRKNMAFSLAVLLCVLGLVVVGFNRKAIRNWLDGRVHAQSDIMASQLADPNGGLGQYGKAIQSSTSYSATVQAVNNWNSYVGARSNWWLSSAYATRLANADWNARQSGAPTITAQQLANAVNDLIAFKLSGMTAAQETALYNAMTAELLPDGTSYSPNSGLQEVTATQNSDGTFTVTVSATAFSDQKTFFQQEYPGMVSSGTNFFPAEAVYIFYSIAAGDMGWSNSALLNVKNGIGSATGLDMSSRMLFGDHGYLARRPMNTFCDDAGINRLFTDLGF